MFWVFFFGVFFFKMGADQGSHRSQAAQHPAGGHRVWCCASRGGPPGSRCGCRLRHLLHCDTPGMVLQLPLWGVLSLSCQQASMRPTSADAYLHAAVYHASGRSHRVHDVVVADCAASPAALRQACHDAAAAALQRSMTTLWAWWMSLLGHLLLSVKTCIDAASG